MSLSFDNLEIYQLLLKVCTRHGVDPSSSLEAENLFRDLLLQYAGASDSESIIEWLNEQVLARFVALNERPRWIQAPNWPFADGRPLIFVGQIDVSVRDSKIASGFFHDDASFYLFIQPKGPTVVVEQQF